jgi:hypothetical protein
MPLPKTNNGTISNPLHPPAPSSTKPGSFRSNLLQSLPLSSSSPLRLASSRLRLCIHWVTDQDFLESEQITRFVVAVESLEIWAAGFEVNDLQHSLGSDSRCLLLILPSSRRSDHSYRASLLHEATPLSSPELFLPSRFVATCFHTFS